MDIYNLSINHFYYFIKVAECKTMLEAAEQLHVSQPLLSQKLAQLETTLGFKLFTRHKMRLQLTDAGVVLLQESKQFIGDLTSACQELHDQYANVSKRFLKIGFSESQESLPIQLLLSKLRESFPDISIDAVLDNKAMMTYKLLNNELDICCILDTEEIRNDTQLSYQSIYQVPLSCIVGPASPLFYKDRVEWSDLTNRTCFTPSLFRNTKLSKDILRYTADNGISYQMKMIRQSANTYILMTDLYLPSARLSIQTP